MTLISSSSFSSISSSISSLFGSFPSALLEFKLANSIDSLLTFKCLDFFFFDLTLVLALLLVSSSNKSFSILSCLIFFFLPNYSDGSVNRFQSFGLGNREISCKRKFIKIMNLMILWSSEVDQMCSE